VTKPLLVFDGDCGFCRRWIAHWQALTGDRVRYAPFQEVAGQFPQISLEQSQQSVQLVESDGTVSSGAKAVVRTLTDVPGKRWLRWAYEHVPGIAMGMEWSYRLIARHRGAGATVTRWLWGDHVGPESYRLTRWVFLRLLGLVYLIAFLSLGTQIHGLVGRDGISPAGAFLQAARGHLGAAAYWFAPTLCWLSSSDATLTLLCVGGAVLAIFLIVGFAPVPVLTLLWAAYLSLTVIGQEFLAFQWDILLLETGFLAIFLAPLRIRPRWPAHDAQPPAPVLWLLRWLLFRLIFSSGAVKLVSGDPTWRSLTALTYHYETQPLPTWIGWYAHQMPVWFHEASCAVMFAVELGAPFLIFAPRRLRAWGCGILLALQGLIVLTGNYTFFNLLTVALCLLLLDDAMWLTLRGGPSGPAAAQAERAGCPERERGTSEAEHRSDDRPRWGRSSGAGRTTPEARKPWPRWVIAPVAAAILLLSIVPVLALFRGRLPGPRPLIEAYRAAAPFHLVNSYGLFAVMTTSRPEIIVEGSHDGVAWQAYEFRFKPGEPTRPPGFVAPHQPRLDWQMWFAALGRYEANPWFIRFCERLLRDTPEVLALLAKNPFPEAPPRYVRAVLYDYRFTDLATKREEGAWWRRARLRLYCPALSLKHP